MKTFVTTCEKSHNIVIIVIHSCLVTNISHIQLLQIGHRYTIYSILNHGYILLKQVCSGKNRLISIESQPKKNVVVVVVVIGVGIDVVDVVAVVHVVAVVIPVVDTRNIPNKVWLKPGY